MKALDTNVLARFFVDDPDDPQSAMQRPAAVAALSERAFIPLTVLLEFEWVLRGFYKLTRGEIVVVMRALAGIEHVTLESRDLALAALEGFEAGLDFADALHLQRSAHASAFATFDRRLAKRAKALATVPAVELLG